jgi:hypothetical protein
MPKQEVFMDAAIGDKQVQVLKTYDAAYAREAFDAMDVEALKFLTLWLDIEDLPAPESPDFADTIWEAVEDGAREDWNSFSYFVVTESTSGRTIPLFVSPDWPTAEAFAQNLTESAETA